MEKLRTQQQNKALHLWITQLTRVLNEAGIDLKEVLTPNVRVMPTEKNVKEVLWRPIQEAMFGKRSTTTLSTQDIDKIYDVINRHLADNWLIQAPPWPDKEQQYRQRFDKNLAR